MVLRIDRKRGQWVAVKLINGKAKLDIIVQEAHNDPAEAPLVVLTVEAKQEVTATGDIEACQEVVAVAGADDKDPGKIHQIFKGENSHDATNQ